MMYPLDRLEAVCVTIAEHPINHLPPDLAVHLEELRAVLREMRVAFREQTSRQVAAETPLE